MTARLRTLVGLLRRLQQTRGRLALVGAVGAALTLTGLAVNIGGGGRGAVVGLLTEPVFLIAVPLTAMVFAVASLGDLDDDGTLVYVWLRPLPRWHLATGAVAATAQLAVPLNLGLVAAVAVVAGQPGLLPGALTAVALGTLAYGGLFVALGLRTRRSLLWGLGYVLLIEGFLSRFSDVLLALSVRRYVGSVFAGISHARTPDVPLSTAVPVLAAVALAGTALTTWWLRSRDVA